MCRGKAQGQARDECHVPLKGLLQQGFLFTECGFVDLLKSTLLYEVGTLYKGLLWSNDSFFAAFDS